MGDEPTEPGVFLKEQLENMLILLDRHELHLAAARLAQAIEAIQVDDER